MPARTARRIAGAEPRLGQRDHEPVGPAGDGLVDELAHALERVDVGRAVGDQRVHLARGRLDAVADDRPERARRLAVGDDRDADLAALPAGPAPGGRGAGRRRR